MKEFSVSGVIFDFNGTLFYDTHFHDQAWIEFAGKHGKTLTTEDLTCRVHGATNKDTLEYLFNRKLSVRELNTFSDQKEEIYRSLCISNPGQCILTPGAETFLNLLKQNSIPRTIATASVLRNVNFYFELFPLDNWFDRGRIIYDTGEYRGKPHPDMFLAAARALNLPVNKCMIIEDSMGGIQAAKSAGAASLVVFSNNSQKFSQIAYIDQIITDFRQIKLAFTGRENSVG